MTQEIKLIHRKGPERFGFADELVRNRGAFSFQTCLRHLVIADEETLSSIEDQLHPSDEVLVGHDVYRFLLEVICGLRSSLIGETEVYGQFRTAVQRFHGPSSPWGHQIGKIFRALFEDAKRIRGEHLKDLGSQSYGSLMRRELRDHCEIHMIGSGHLAGEIFPWIAKENKTLFIYSRNAERARFQLCRNQDIDETRIHFLRMDEAPRHIRDGALIVAAPLAASAIDAWMQSGERLFSTIVDLRGESVSDALPKTDVLTLEAAMRLLSSQQSLAMVRKAAALHAIEAVSQERQRAVENRPFGWDDVCA